MVHKYQRYNHLLLRKAELGLADDDGDDYEDEEESRPLGLACSSKRTTRPRIFSLLLISLLSCSLVLLPLLLTTSPSTFSLIYSSFQYEDLGLVTGTDSNASLCSSIPNGTLCCDRATSIRSDICIVKGDVRTNSASSSIFLYTSHDNTNSLIDSYAPGLAQQGEDDEIRREKIKPYTRKWEKSVMDTIDELDLVVKRDNSVAAHKCDVHHGVPAIFFSTGGYTGNVYHEFNDGILPLYITSQNFNKKVVFVILEYHNWWYSKYADILGLLSDYPPIDFRGDNRTHCFPEAIVGLRIHDELAIDSSLMEGNNKTIHDFRNLLDNAYRPRIRGLIQEEARKSKNYGLEMVRGGGRRKKPKLVILSRNGSRAITNEDSMAKMAEEIGFQVEILRPGRNSELAMIYRVLNSSDVLVGVHGAAMTHFLFMNPGCVFVQVIPLGTAWAADAYYGQPALKLGLKYVGYEILPTESSLYHEYGKDDPVLTDPGSVNKKGWEFTKKVYLDRQNVRLNLKRFRKRLVRSYFYTVARKNRDVHIRSP